MFDRDNWTPQNIVIGLGVLFLIVWILSGEFMVAAVLVALILLRVPMVRRALWTWWQTRPTLHRYGQSRFDPSANPPNEDAELHAMPRYSEGRVTTPAEAPPVRTYFPDDEEDSAPIPDPRRDVRFARSPPPKKPVQLPRHRP
jgi:hypothetical protein